MPEVVTIHRQTTSPDQSAVSCRICGRVFRTLFSHLRTHGLTAHEYREKFPGASTVCGEVWHGLVRSGTASRELQIRTHGIGFAPSRRPTGANPAVSTADAGMKPVVSEEIPTVRGCHTFKVAG